MPIVDERHALQHCLSECKERLNLYRREGMELQEALAESELNRMLDRLRELLPKKDRA